LIFIDFVDPALAQAYAAIPMHHPKSLQEGLTMKRNQSGFTLIEIAIVLVIIGLLLGGVLKGQELINSAKVKNLASSNDNPIKTK